MTILVSANEKAPAVLSADYERTFLQVRHDHGAGCLVQEILRDAFVRRRHDFLQYAGCGVETFGGLGSAICSSGRATHQWATNGHESGDSGY